ncbi:MAG: PKD domain-containing protein [Bacteroidetes bacterium]|jgi:hypothetical protein|nr:PKD domain-containing protein [Bacteroidota bacterium]MBT6685802.1 PKD domain-containing protein [Bacteroidota bacterium]MBT7143714.1 PKD domain-containing protein [Bacteroidota bacterium]MBT7491941.1 PKD domain-containing protein [Bacteroidota bacterium]
MKRIKLLFIILSFTHIVNSQCTWDLPPNQVNPNNISWYALLVIPTPYGVTTVNACGVILDSLDIVGAFIDSANSGNLKCVGYLEYDGVTNMTVRVWGNYPPNFYGPEPGDTLIWKVWDYSEDIEYFVHIPFPISPTGGLTYVVYGDFIIDTIYADIWPNIAASHLIDTNRISFENLSKSHLNSFWDFGDGDTSSLENPIHIYQENDVFTVTLTISNDCHSVDTSFSVKIEAYPVAYFEYSVSAKEVTFDNLSNYATNYVWDFGDSNSSIEENPIYTFAEDGIYVVSLTAINSLSDSIYIDTIEIETSGIEKIRSFEIVYPNPNSGKFQILLNRKCQSISIYDCLGTKIFGQEISNSEIEIDISQLPAGIYFLHFSYKNGFETLQIVKE